MCIYKKRKKLHKNVNMNMVFLTAKHKITLEWVHKPKVNQSNMMQKKMVLRILFYFRHENIKDE